MARINSYSDPDTDVRMLLSLVTDEVIDDTTVQYFIDRAENYIDSRLAKRYDVPITNSPTPPILTDISANLAAYGVLKRLKLEVNDTEQDYARTFKDDAMRMLKEIESGLVDILDDNGDTIEPLSKTGILSSTTDYKPIFNEGDETSWAVDDDKIYDDDDKYN